MLILFFHLVYFLSLQKLIPYEQLRIFFFLSDSRRFSYPLLHQNQYETHHQFPKQHFLSEKLVQALHQIRIHYRLTLNANRNLTLILRFKCQLDQKLLKKEEQNFRCEKNYGLNLSIILIPYFPLLPIHYFLLIKFQYF